MPNTDFRPFAKIPRFSSPIIVTEKIDGTNALVYISDDGQTLRAGSRNRWIEVQNDNFGFALWCKQHEAELKKLGPGFHYGEWMGLGIQRGYDLFERRFYLFNVSRWHDLSVRPACCRVVPELVHGDVRDVGICVEQAMDTLKHAGSQAVPGYMNPEGVVIYHERGRLLFKKTFVNDEEGKGAGT